VVLVLLLFGFGQWGLTPVAGKTLQELTLAQFVAGLRRAVAANDRRAVAGMVRYPIEVSAGGLQIPVPDAATFVQLYDSAFGPAVRQAVMGARVATDARAPLTLGGSLTISETAGGFRITGIKVLTGPQSKPPGEPIERHLTFRVGQPTQVSGTLEPGGTDRYVFYAVRGAYVEARLSGVPGKTVLMRLLDAKTSTPVDARANAGTRVWTGRVSADGSYRIEVVRQPESGNEPLIYSMAVVVK
jgi:hypothetical protein